MLKKIIFILLLFLILGGCTMATVGSKGMTDADKERLLAERVKLLWDAMVKRDRETIYDMYDPFFKSRENKLTFAGRQIPIYYYNPEIRQIDIKGNVATVKVKIEYEIKGFKTQLGTVINEPKKEVITTETWLFIDDNWYKEYIDQIFDSTLAPY